MAQQDRPVVLFDANGVRMTPSMNFSLPYGYEESSLASPYWATSLRAEELWDQVLSKELKLPKGTWVAVRYTGEYLTAKSERKLDKLYDEKHWLSESECPFIVQFGCELEVVQGRMHTAVGQGDSRS
jgi:hypothetical protein